MKRIISFLLVFSMLFSFALIPSAAAPTGNGITFTAEDGYETVATLSAAPRTIETWIKVDADASAERLGIIVGNYVSGSYKNTMIDLEIRKNGNPYLYWREGISSSVTANFTDVDLRTGEWIHLAVVSTTTDAKCYINGELKQTVENTFADVAADSLSKFMIGGDYRTDNTRYLQSSAVGSVALFSDSRTAEEIAADYEAVDYTEDTLICAYDLSASGTERLKDHSANENHLAYTNTADPSKNEQYGTMTEGMAFDNLAGTYYLENGLAAPHTIEAEIYFPASYSTDDRGGAIIGNYPGSAKSCVNFEIYTNGRIRYYWIDEKGDDYAAYFNVDAYSGEWLKIAVTHDNEAGVIKGYLNGELIGTVTDKNVGGGPAVFDNFVLGGDGRSGNAQYFKGNLKSVAMYSDIRTDEEIKADANSYGTDDLILHYDLSGYTYTDRPAKVTDLAGNSDAVYEYTWLSSEEIETDYAYSFAVVGDTQCLNDFYPEHFQTLYDWIIENKSSKNIQYVFGLGDITNNSLIREWDEAVTAFDKLSDAGIPYSVVRGNHDKQTVTVDTKKTFNDALSTSKYATEITAEQRFNADELETTYRTFTVGDEKFVSITLDYGPTDEELAWASSVCEKYPDHKVIVTTHAYMFRDGTTLDSGDVVPPSNSDPSSNNGDEVWDEFVKNHKNIILVMSGHDPSKYIVTRKDVGVNGNTVTQMLVDAQTEEKNRGALGMVTMLYFSKDGKCVEVEHYSTVRDEYFLKDNQFTMTWNELTGDVDLDYVVDIEDVMRALLATINDEKLDRADINCDGRVNLKDALRILKYAIK